MDWPVQSRFGKAGSIMRLMPVGLGALLWAAACCGALGQVSETNWFGAVDRPVPDGTISGIEDSRTHASPIVELTGVRVRLQVVHLVG